MMAHKKYFFPFFFQEDEGIAFRGLFIIDGAGKLRQITVNDLPVGRDVDETLRLVQAFQFTDQHGEVREERMRTHIPMREIYIILISKYKLL